MTEVQLCNNKEQYGRRLMVAVVDETAKSSSHKVFASIPQSSDLSDGWRDISTAELAHAIDCVAWRIVETIGMSANFETLAYLGMSDVRYAVFCLAGIKAGYKTLLPSPRNQDIDTIYLLRETGCTKFFHAVELTSKVAGLKVGMTELLCFSLPAYDEITSGELRQFSYNKSWNEAMKDPVIVLQTSGSTGPPKPIVLTNEFISTFDNHYHLIPPIGRRIFSMASVSGRYYSAFPSFHMSGLMTGIATPIFTDSTAVMGPASALPSGGLVVQMIQTAHVRKLFLPPSIIEQLPRDEEALQILNSIDWICTGGGPLAPTVGDDIAKRTTICQIFGQTETGWPPMLIPNQRYWSFLEFYPGAGSEMELIGDELYELVVNKDPNLDTRAYQGPFTIFPELRKYRTKDLFSRHSSQPNLWRFEGRSDDIIVLSNGEKFNPVPMELIIQGHPSLKGALIAGQGRFRSALLVEPKYTVELEGVVEMIWPTIETANMAAPKHARILKTMIISTIPGKPFVRTGKGSIIRKHTLKEYETKIEALYKRGGRELSQVLPLEGPKDLTSVRNFVRSCVSSVVSDEDFDHGADFFVCGMDSLGVLDLAARLRAGLNPVNTTASIESAAIARMIYANATIEVLSGALFKSLNMKQRSLTEDSERFRDSRMQALVEKYTTSLPSLLSKQVQVPLETRQILLTGSTGSLGSSLLAKLLLDPKIEKIFCLDRSKEAAARHRSNFETRGLPESLLSTKAEFLQVDLARPDFGLSDEVMNRLSGKVDIIIHNAWQVDFNVGLPSFEAVHIRGVRNIVDFSLASKRQPQIFFTSSISAGGNWARNHGDTKVPETILDNYTDALPHGYGESKHVAERILAEVAMKTGMQATILRLGQIAGSGCETDPAWNKAEMIPVLLKTSMSMKKAPKTLGKMNVVNWIPVDALVEVFRDLIFRSPPATTPLEIFNLVNPRSTSWEELLSIVDQDMGTGLEVVEYLDWVKLVAACDPLDVDAKPALKMMDFFEDLGMRSALNFDTSLAEAASVTMKRMKAVTPQMMNIWMKQWQF